MSTKLFVQLTDAGDIEAVSVECKDRMGTATVYRHASPDGKLASIPDALIGLLPWIRARADEVNTAKLRVSLSAAGVPDDELDDAVTAAKARRK